MRTTIVGGLALLGLLWGGTAAAACTGSGLTWSCTAGSSVANVQSAVNAATDGAEITLADGTYTFSTSLDLNNIDGVTLKCASIRACTVNYGSGVISRDYIPTAITRLIRVSGFVFSGNPGTAAIWMYGAQNMTQVRIDNNTFKGQGTGTISILLGETSATGHAYGVIDHNLFTGASNIMGVKLLNGGAGAAGDSTWEIGLRGTGNNMFIENNTYNFTQNQDLGSGGIDAWRASGVVFRYNSLTNTRYVNHSYCHGGPVSAEVYGNTITSPNSSAPQYRNIHFQGSGEIMVWGNTVENVGGTGITIQHFRGDPATATSEGNCNSLCDGTRSIDGNRSPTSTYHGYPCWHQPGRDGAGTLKPVYSFLNKTNGGTRVPVGLSFTGTYHFIENRDWYQDVSASLQTSPTSPFNGSTGVGMGTLANRPTSCTTGSEAADAGKGGVGYWATDGGSNWNTSNGGGNDGALYVCTASNTWSLYYTPYTYPHPLAVGGVDVNPNPPTDVILTRLR